MECLWSEIQKPVVQPNFVDPYPLCGKAVSNRYIWSMDKKDKHSDHDPETGAFVEGNQAHTKRVNPGRKSKASGFMRAFACVVNDPHPVGMAIIHSDKDLLGMVNRRLEDDGEDECCISLATWERYKRGEEGDYTDRVLDDLEGFGKLYEKALVEQRNNLFKRMTEKGEARSWGRWSWIIERKFDEWNLRKKQVDETPDRKQLVFRVEGDGDG